MSSESFASLLYEKSASLYRPMPWREDTRPYFVLVSELMLQQTQVSRVIPKFQAFIAKFPDEATLASASLADVLTQWQGLGYNRRAKYLHEAAKMIVRDFAGAFPTTRDQLLELPGVGKNTAGAVQAYSFNQPALFVETNIRTVYIHHFFHDQSAISDAQILEKLAATIDQENPRVFYQALMDYGTWLKANGVRNNASSKHYKKQAPLKGSVREVRGHLVAWLAAEGDQPLAEAERRYHGDARFEVALAGLKKDGLVALHHSKLHLTK